MKYRYLGACGLPVSRVCLGTMTFGAEGWGCDEQTSHHIPDRFRDAGGNFVDTADIDAEGESERHIGTYLTGNPRDDLIVTSKCFFPTGNARTARGLSRKHIAESCEASLKRLQTDYIDLYYVHGV